MRGCLWPRQVRRSGRATFLAVLFATGSALSLHAQAVSANEGDLRPSALTCEHLFNPLGIDVLQPRLSWINQSVDPTRRHEGQTAYRILVASSAYLLAKDSGDLWDTGKVVSPESVLIPYAGKALISREACYWKVIVWDSNGSASPESGMGNWSMGLLNPEDWTAHWIGSATPEAELKKHNFEEPAPLLRKAITIAKPVARAMLYASGLGYSRLFLNGAQIGDHRLDPGFTRYDERVLYDTYDITSQLHDGANVLGAELGNGWYNHVVLAVWDFEKAKWRDRPKLLLQLELDYADGTREVVTSDSSWKTKPGPLVFNGLFNGDIYDARLEEKDWNATGFDDSSWAGAQVVAAPEGVLSAVMTPSVRVTAEITPVGVKEVRPGLFVFDLGRNFAGVAELHVTGPSGTQVTLQYAEELKKDGTIDLSPLTMYTKSGEFQTDQYTLKGGGEEIWSPPYVYDGFRYVQVTGFPGTPTTDSLRGLVFHTALDSAGSFRCSNDLLNKIQKATEWTYLNNFHDHPTDCPTREKNGWTGDAQLAVEAGLYNFDPAANYTKWLRDFQDAQLLDGALPGIIPTATWGYIWGYGPSWDSAYLNIPWAVYQFRGDTRILSDHYDGIKNYVDCLTRVSQNGIVAIGLGDWESTTPTPTEVTSTAYYYHDALLLSKMANLLGHTDDAQHYAALARDIKKAFNARFYHPGTHDYANGSQTALSCALYQGLVEDENIPRVVRRLVAKVHKAHDHIDCGILGTKYLLHALTDHGKSELAYKVATQPTFPGWGNWISQGATTLWERWDGQGSQDHIMCGDISAWFYETLAGIRPGEAAPGFREFRIAPEPLGDLTWVKSSHQTPYGEIVSNWEKKKGRFLLEVHVPVGTRALIVLPTHRVSGILEGGKPIAHGGDLQPVGNPAGNAGFLAASGVYHFDLPLP